MSPATEPTSLDLRQIEALVLVDRDGRVWAPGLIDVTLRYRERVMLAESPPPGLPADLDRSLLSTATRLAADHGTAGAFTVAFFADASSGEYRVQSIAPGLSAHAPVIEVRYDSDLPALESQLSNGGILNNALPEPRGYALQICLSAWDPENDFAPSPGVVESLSLPSGRGLWAEASVEEGTLAAGEEVIVRLTALGPTRTEALTRLQRGLASTIAFLRDGATDKPFLAELLERPEVTGNKAPPFWIDQMVASGEHLPRRGSEVALLAVAISDYESELADARRRFYGSAARGRPVAPKEIGQTVELRYRGQDYVFHVARLEPRRYRIEAEGRRLEVVIDALGRTGRRFACGSRIWQVFFGVQASRQMLEVDGISHYVERDIVATVRAPVSAVVVSVAVREGDRVTAGTPLAVLETMVMETTLIAPFPGCVRRVLVRVNTEVSTGGPMFVIEELRAERPGANSARIRFDILPLRGNVGSPRSEVLEEIIRFMLGYDVETKVLQRLSTAGVDDVKAETLRLEEEILQTYVDLGSLFRRATEEHNRDSSEEYFVTYLRNLDARGEGLPASFLTKLRRALAHYGVNSLDRSPELEDSLFRIGIAYQRLRKEVSPVVAVLESWLERKEWPANAAMRDLLEQIIADTHQRDPVVHDVARQLRYRYFDRPLLLENRERMYAAAEADLGSLASGPGPEERVERIRTLVECTEPLHLLLSQRITSLDPDIRSALLEVMVRRYYRELSSVEVSAVEGQDFLFAGYDHRGSHIHLVATHAGYDRLAWSLDVVSSLCGVAPVCSEVVADLYFWRASPEWDEVTVTGDIARLLENPALPKDLRRVAVVLSGADGSQHFTFQRSEDGIFREERVHRGIHPMQALRLEFWRLENFHLKRLPASDGVYFFRGVARENPRDERLFAMAEVSDLTPVRNAAGHIVELPQFEWTLMEVLADIRRFQSRRAASKRLHWNRILLNVWPPVDLRPDELNTLVHRLAPLSDGLGLEKVNVRCRIPDHKSGELRDWVLQITNFEGAGMVLRFRRPAETPLKPLREYAQKVVELRRRGLLYPYEVVKSLAPSQREVQVDLPAGEFVEHDLGPQNSLVPVDRPYGGNTANIVVGVVRNYTHRYPEGMARVILLGDPSRGMGALAEPECRRIVAALDLAQGMGLPLEWFALSGGAKIAMDSGTENMDWIGVVLRRIVEFTQSGGEINIVVTGINVGAQPYWNAEATMLMHTRGILVMTPEGAMVLTGKQALDYSGGVSAEDNQGIGGYERIMGPNGQAQYFARDLSEACRILLRHYDHCYVVPGERFPRPAPTRDPRDRDVRDFPHGGEFRTVGELFSDLTNPGRKRPFEIRRVMAAVCDQDQPPLERWYGMRDAEIAVVWDAHLGGHPVCLLGFESKPLPRLGWVPVYGPDHWAGSTLFPLASKKVARAINAASGNRPLVVLANLSGFDGSPESMRQWQLEYGAEIGRAVVNFKGPIVFCVVSRYHGGAFVVFSNALHDNLEVAALEGTYASVIGGAPAAAQVFADEVEERTRHDPRISELEKAVADPGRPDRARLLAQLTEISEEVRSEKLGEVAEEFDHIHNLERAWRVGSIHHILPAEELRPFLISAVERGMAKELAGLGTSGP